MGCTTPRIYSLCTLYPVPRMGFHPKRALCHVWQQFTAAIAKRMRWMKKSVSSAKKLGTQNQITEGPQLILFSIDESFQAAGVS